LASVSFSFYVTTYSPPLMADVIAAVDDHGDLRVAENLADPWPPGFAYHLHRAGASTRGVELCWEPDRVQVRMLTLASHEDWELAFRVLEEIAREGVIETEDEREVKAVDLRSTFAGMCDQTNTAGTEFLVSRINDEGASLTLPGPVRAFCIGPRLLKELSQGSEDELPARILEQIRRVQYTGEARDYYCASVLQASVEDDLGFTLTAFGPGVRYLLPDVQFVALVGEGDEELFLDYDSFLRLLGGWCRYLDERQVFVEALSGPNWDTFLAVARGCRVEPVPFLKGEVDHEDLAQRVARAGSRLAETLLPPTPDAAEGDVPELDRAVELLESAWDKRPADLSILGDLALAYGQRAQSHHSQGAHETALRDQDRVLRLQAKLARRDPTQRPELALAWARRSDFSVALDAPRDALADLERAAAILEDCLEGGGRDVALNLMATRCRQAEVCARIDDDKGARDALAQAETLCAQRDEPEAWGRLLRIRARLQRRRDPAAALLDLERAFRISQGSARSPEELDEFFALAEELWEERMRQLDVAAATAVVARSLEVLEREVEGDRARASWISRVLGAQATFEGARRDYSAALATAERALKLTMAAARPGDEEWVARAYNTLASTLEDQGELARAADAYAHALAAFSRADVRGGELLRTRLLRASILIDAGRPVLARNELDRALAQLPAEPEGEAGSWLHAGALHQRARVGRLLGQVERAQEDVVHSQALLAGLQDGDPYCEGYLAVVRVEAAEIASALGRTEEARANAEQGLAVLVRHGEAGLHFGLQAVCDAERLLAKLDRQGGNPEGALARIDALVGRLDDRDPPLRLAQLQRARAAALADLGRREEAARALSEACRLLGRIDHLPQLLATLRDALALNVEVSPEVAAALEDVTERLPREPGPYTRRRARALGVVLEAYPQPVAPHLLAALRRL
jgi:tetratricopeptide (TPR) repeat protein